MQKKANDNQMSKDSTTNQKLTKEDVESAKEIMAAFKKAEPAIDRILSKEKSALTWTQKIRNLMKAADDAWPLIDSKELMNYLAGRKQDTVITIERMREIYRAAHKYFIEIKDEKAFLDKFGTEEVFMSQFIKQPYDQ